MDFNEFLLMLVKNLQLEEPCTEEVELSLRLKCVEGRWALVAVSGDEKKSLAKSGKKKSGSCKPCKK